MLFARPTDCFSSGLLCLPYCTRALLQCKLLACFHHQRHEQSQLKTAAAVHAHVSSAGSGSANAQQSVVVRGLSLGGTLSVSLLSRRASSFAKWCHA